MTRHEATPATPISPTADEPAPAASNAGREQERARRREEIAQWRAERLGIPLEQARSARRLEPQYLAATRRRADRLNVPVEQLLEDSLASLRELRFPTPECLDPHEVEQAVADELADDRLRHAASCEFCRPLLEMARPNEERTEDFLNEVTELCRERGLPAETLASDDGEFDAGEWDETDEWKKVDEAAASVAAAQDGSRARKTGKRLALAMVGAGSGWVLAVVLMLVALRYEFFVAPVMSPGDDVQALTYSPDRSRKALVMDDGSVIVIDEATQQRILVVEGGPAMASVDFEEDGRIFVNSGDGIVSRYMADGSAAGSAAMPEFDQLEWAAAGSDDAPRQMQAE